MKVTIETAEEFARNIMDSRQLADYNAWAKTSYESVEELLETETAEELSEFFTP